MPKSWCSAPADGAGGSSSSGGDCRRRRHSPPPSVSTVASSSAHEEILISSGDEEDQPPPHSYIGDATLTDEDFVRQMELMMQRSLRDMGPSPRPSPEQPSPPCNRVKQEPGATIKEESASPPRHNRGIQIGRRMKEEPASSPRHNRGVQIRRRVKEEPASPTRSHRLSVNTELPPVIKKARGRLLHYLGGGGYSGPSGSRAVVFEVEREARLREQYDRCNADRRSSFAKTDVAPEWVRNDLDLAFAWALDYSVTTAETAARRRRLDGELAKIGEEWSLSDCSANASHGKGTVRAPKAMSAVATAALRTAQQEADRLRQERQVMAR